VRESCNPNSGVGAPLKGAMDEGRWTKEERNPNSGVGAPVFKRNGVL
jgi:hypothetical protein